METNEFFDARAAAQASISDLDRLSTAAHTLGNTTLALKLDAAIDNLSASVDTMADVFHRSILDACRASEVATFQLVQGVLGGIELGRAEK